MELLISKAGRSEGKMKAPVSARGLRKEVQTFIDCNDVLLNVVIKYLTKN